MRIKYHLIIIVVLITLASISYAIRASTQKDSYTILLKISPNAFKYNGKELKGYIEVIVNTPKGIITKHYKVDSKSVIKIPIVVSRETFNSWNRLYSKASQLGYKNSVKPLPTIAIIPYLYDDEGNKYIGTYILSSASYLMLYKGMPLAQAVMKAQRDPFILFKEEPTIVIKSAKELHISKKKTVLPDIIEKRLKKKEQILQNTRHRIKILVNPMDIGSQSTCQPLQEIWFDELYNSANSPPEGWLSHIYNVDSYCKEGLWYFLATRFSYAYYYPTSEYSASDAVNAVVALTGVPEGIYTVDDFLYRLASKSAEACISAKWSDSISAEFKLYNVPVIGARLIVNDNKPIRVGLIFAGFGATIYTSGITYGDTVIDPVEHTLNAPITGTINDTSLYSVAGSKQGYIFVPTLYYMQGDGVAIIYTVDEVNINGCNYYRVVPILEFIPLYMQYYMDLNKDDIIVEKMPLDAQPPQDFNELVWSPYSVQVYSDYLTNLPVETKIYEDMTAGGVVSGIVAGGITNPIKTFVDIMMSAIFGAGGEGGVLASTFYTILSSSFAHAEFTAGVSAIGVKITIEASNNIDYLYITVDKTTIRDAATSSYIPLLSYYTITIGQFQPPPGALQYNGKES